MTLDSSYIGAAASINSGAEQYPPDEWAVTGELIRQIGSATTWQRVVEAGNALMKVQRMAQCMREEMECHAKSDPNVAPFQGENL